MARRSHRPYKFLDIHHSVDGLVATGLGILSILMLVGEMIMTVQSRGQVGGIAGYMGVIAFCSTVVGLIFSILSWKDEETMDTFKRIGTFMNIILILLNLVIILLGIFAG